MAVVFPLLSIIIPTKNRQYTCLYAIETALLVPQNDIEVIVQDCSDTNILEKQILDKFGNDIRIKYEYTNTKPNMTENWNRAFERSSGKYLCAIGDDDAVLAQIYSITLLAQQNSYLVLCQPDPCSYKWPDFGGSLAGTFTIFRKVNGKIHLFETAKVRNSIKKVDTSYGKLPMLYHCLISRDILEILKLKTGKILDGTSLDAYSAYALSTFIQYFHYIDLPYTIRGACGKSNTNRIFKDRDGEQHFAEYNNYSMPSIVPPVKTPEVSIAESAYKAFVNMDQLELVALINWPYAYAYSALKDKETAKMVLSTMKKQNLPIDFWLQTLWYFFQKIFKKIIRTILEYTNIIFFIEILFLGHKRYKFKTIVEVVKFYGEKLVKKTI